MGQSTWRMHCNLTWWTWKMICGMGVMTAKRMWMGIHLILSCLPWDIKSNESLGNYLSSRKIEIIAKALIAQLRREKSVDNRDKICEIYSVDAKFSYGSMRGGEVIYLERYCKRSSSSIVAIISRFLKVPRIFGNFMHALNDNCIALSHQTRE